MIRSKDIFFQARSGGKQNTGNVPILPPFAEVYGLRVTGMGNPAWLYDFSEEKLRDSFGIKPPKILDFPAA
jgi:hypothetical protein